MAFFKTAVDWVNYTDRYCSKCAHWKEYVEGQGNGCPVMDAHISFGCVDRPNGEVSEILDLLVPKDEKWAMVCRLFAPKAQGEQAHGLGKEQAQIDVGDIPNFQGTGHLVDRTLHNIVGLSE